MFVVSEADKISDEKLLLEEDGGKFCNVVEDLDALTERIQPDLRANDGKSAPWLKEGTILSPTNDCGEHQQHSVRVTAYLNREVQVR